MAFTLVEFMNQIVPWLQIGVLAILVWKTGVAEGILNKLLEMSGKSALSRAGTKTVQLALEEPTVELFLNKYFWLIKPLMAVLGGHFGGNDVEFMRFIANESPNYDMSHAIKLEGVNEEDLDLLEQNLTGALDAVKEKRNEFEQKNNQVEKKEEGG